MKSNEKNDINTDSLFSFNDKKTKQTTKNK